MTKKTVLQPALSEPVSKGPQSGTQDTIEEEETNQMAGEPWGAKPSVLATRRPGLLSSLSLAV